MSPISGVFENLKNFIHIKKNEENLLRRDESLTISKQCSFTEILNSIKSFSSGNAAKITSNSHLRAEELEKILYSIKSNNSEMVNLIIDWCMSNWNNFQTKFKKFKINIFDEYKRQIDSKGALSIGNFGNKLLALHELVQLEPGNFSGFILSFEKDANLSPLAKLQFYSDPYGEHLIHELSANKTTKSQIETIVFDQTKVWVNYIPGTRAFYTYDWYIFSADSSLPCSQVYIPKIWSLLVLLTDYCTSSIFSEINVDNLKIFEKFIKVLLIHCTSVSYPAEIQRRFFNIANRVILKATKYVSMLEGQKKIKRNELNISQKFNIIGIDESSVIQLINNINSFNSVSNNNTDRSFSSAYVVEGVEIILSILAVIKESYTTLDLYLKETFDYSLPFWIEAIIKLGQFLNFFQGAGQLEGELMKDIFNQLNISNQSDKLFIIKNIPVQIEDSVIITQVENILLSHNTKIVNKLGDIKIINEEDNKTKSVVILIDNFNVSTLKEVDDEPEPEPEPEEEMWNCVTCQMPTAMEYQNCLYCDKPRGPLPPKEVKPKKQSLIKVHAYTITVKDIVNNLKNNIKNDKLLSSYETYEDVQEEIIAVKKKDDKIDQTEQLKNQNLVLENLPFSGDMIETNQAILDEVIKLEEQKKLDKSNESSIPTPPKREYKTVKKTINHVNELTIIQGDELKNLFSPYEPLLNIFFKRRMISYLKLGTDYIKTKINKIEQMNLSSLENDIKNLNYLYDLRMNKSDWEEEINKHDKTNYVKLFKSLENAGIDFWFEFVVLDTKSRNKDINMNLAVIIRELVDIQICKEGSISFVYPAENIRIVPESFESINHSKYNLIMSHFKDLQNVSLSEIRYYWTIIRYFNVCLQSALPFIKPPEFNNVYEQSDDPEFINIPFPKSMSAFLSSSKGISFSITKQNLIREVISNTEFPDEEVQIPTLRFERLQIQTNLQNSTKKNTGNINIRQAGFIRNAEQIDESENIIEVADMKTDESIFLSAHEQSKDIDPAFFRSKKAPGDPHVAFKIDLKNEMVQGIGGPYRQFFSDTSAELQPKDFKNKKVLKLLHPTNNNTAKIGEFKDRYTLTPGYNSNSALNHYEYLGILMGICIRTGVHLTLDFCTLVWKKLAEEKLTADDILEYDEGLIEKVNTYLKCDDAESFDAYEEYYSQELTDNTIVDLVPNGRNQKVKFEDCHSFLRKLIKSRISEIDIQISAIRKGLCKIIPDSLIRLLTHKELERLICGKKVVDIELLKKHTKYTVDLNENSQRVKWLWEVLNEFSEEDKIKFIKFCWAQERLPSTTEEFERLQIKFTIKPYMDKNRKDQFPKADTCFFSVELSDYTTKEVMKQKILTAINFDNGLNGDKVNLDAANNMNNNDFGRNNYDDEEDEEDIE